MVRRPVSVSAIGGGVPDALRRGYHRIKPPFNNMGAPITNTPCQAAEIAAEKPIFGISVKNSLANKLTPFDTA